MMNQPRTQLLVFCAAVALFIFAASHQLADKTSQALHTKLTTHFCSSSELGTETASHLPTFEEIALKYGTDKVTAHQYQHMYDRYLSPLRGRKIKMLEIGLGCNMDYGPGASYYTWLEFFPNIELYFIEYDAKCAEKYKHKTGNAHVYVGDQANVTFLTNFSAQAMVDGLFDVIIDDGGHTMEQQITSLENLWPIVQLGGLYFIEDLQTSFWDQYGGDPSTRNQDKHTTMKYLYQLLNDLMAGRQIKPISRALQSMECMAEICVLRKKDVSWM